MDHDQQQRPDEPELERRRHWIRAHPDWIPCRLPHHSIRDHRFFFLASESPTLDAPASLIELVGAIDDQIDIAGIVKNERDADSLSQLWAAGIVTLVPPGTAVAGPRILAIEPHPDDVALSAGGALLRRRDLARKTVLSVASRTNGTFYMASPTVRYFDVAQISDLRRAESVLAARFLKADYQTLGEPDIAIRHIDPQRYLNDDIRAVMRDYAAYRYSPPPQAEIERLSSLLWRALQQLAPDELWLPLGLGNHFDHRWVRDACLDSLARHWRDLRALKVLCYEDLPYASDYPGSVDAVVAALRRRGAGLERQSVELGDRLADKIECLRIYASQLEMEKIRPMIQRYAKTASTAADGYAETLWQLTRPPSLSCAPIVVARGAPAAPLEDVARRIFERRAQTRRLGLLLGHKVRHGADSARLLLELFPNARLDILASGDNRDELAAVTDPRLRVAFFTTSAANRLLSLLRWAGHLNTTVLMFGDPRWARAVGRLSKALPAGYACAFENLADMCALWRYWLEHEPDRRRQEG